MRKVLGGSVDSIIVVVVAVVALSAASSVFDVVHVPSVSAFQNHRSLSSSSFPSHATTKTTSTSKTTTQQFVWTKGTLSPSSRQILTNSLHHRRRKHDGSGGNSVNNFQAQQQQQHHPSHNSRSHRPHRAISVPFNAATKQSALSPFSISSSSSFDDNCDHNQEQQQPYDPQISSSSSWDDIYASSTNSLQNYNHDSNGSSSSSSSSTTTKMMKDRLSIISVTTAILVAFATVLRVSEPGSWRYFLAGGICAAVSHAIPTPIDVIKTRKQVDPILADKSMLVAGRAIVKEEGLSALWAGLGPTAWGYLFEGAVKFGVYEISKPVMTSFLKRLATITSMSILRSKVVSFILCGSMAGFAASILLCPMEALRIRMVAEPDFAPKGWVQGGMKIIQNEGIQGLSKGLTPMILKQVPYTVTKNVSFDLITRFFYSTVIAAGLTVTPTVSVTVPLLAAAAASVLSTISSQPGDMVLSLVNAHKGTRTVRDFVNDIVRSDRGVRGFFVGFKTRLLLSGVTVTIQLLVYDMVKRLCGIAATGSM